MIHDIRLRFAKRLRTLRKQYGWTQEKLAERADLAYRHIQRLESLKNPPPAKIDTLGKLAKAFRITIAKLLESSYFSPYPTRKSRGFASFAADAKSSVSLKKQKGRSNSSVQP